MASMTYPPDPNQSHFGVARGLYTSTTAGGTPTSAQPPAQPTVVPPVNPATPWPTYSAGPVHPRILLNNQPDARSVAIVFGTYNRRSYLERAVQSARIASGGLQYQMIAVDGGSTDGSREWLRQQPDVVLLEQTGPLTGAVTAFNIGFANAVKRGFPYIAHFNDDAEYMTPGMLQIAVCTLEMHSRVGAVAFEFDLRGRYSFEYVHGFLYSNFGVFRREAGVQAAQAAGDPAGCNWWNPLYRTYGADCELCCWLWKLGWEVRPGSGLRVHDSNATDELRSSNNAGRGPDGGHPDSRLFYQRWPNSQSIKV